MDTKTTKASQPAQVDAYLAACVHPQIDLIRAIRKAILAVGPEIGEEIKWNAPSFFYAGPMKPSNPKEYRRYILNFNLFKPDCVRLIFVSAAHLGDQSGFLTGDYADGRRIAQFSSLQELAAKQDILQDLIRRWLVSLLQEA